MLLGSSAGGKSGGGDDENKASRVIATMRTFAKVDYAVCAGFRASGDPAEPAASRQVAAPASV